MAKKETLTDDGQLEEVDMEEMKAKDKNKEMGMPSVDGEKGRADGEEDGDGGTTKAKEGPKGKGKLESKKSKKEMDDWEDDDEDDDDKEEMMHKKKKKMEGKSKKEMDDMDMDDDDEDDEDEMESKKAKKEEKEIDVDVSEDVSALIDGEELSEDFKTKAATIFEAAVKSKIAKIRKQVREESKKDMEEKTESIQKEMTEKMDEYMNYVVKEWMEENKLAVEQGVRNEVTESFISGLKKLFEEHYIDVPEEKEDVFESLVQEVAELETKLDESTQKHMDTVKELNTYRAKDAFRDIVEGMVDTDIEKMKELTEDVDYESDEQYKEKLNIIKNSYFKSEKKLEDNKDTAATNKEVADGKSAGRMDSVMAAISNLKK